MAEDRKILLDIQVNSEQGLKSLVDLKARISDLKKEQASLNTETKDGKVQFAAYQAQITNLSRESRSLENALAQTAGAFNFEAGSIAANRAEVSKLTAEYKNLGKPTKEQLKTIRDLSDRLKEQEAAIGNTSRNVGNYTESLNAAGLGNTAFGRTLGGAQEGFGKLKSGIDTAKTGFTTLRGAIAATGIGLLVIAFSALVSFIKSTDEGATALEGGMRAIGAITGVLTKGLTVLGKTLFDAISSPKQLIIDLGNLIKDNLINRFTAFGVILEGIKSGNFTKIGDGVVQLGTGIENASGKVNNLIDGVKQLGSDMASAAQEGFNLALAFDDLEDRQRDYAVTNAEANKQVAQLLVQLKNRTNSEKESLAIADQASKIELENYKANKGFAEENLGLIQRDNNLRLIGIGITQQQIDKASALKDENGRLRTEEEKRTSRQALVGKLSGEYAQQEADARVKVIGLEQESLVVQERIQNRRDAIFEKGKAQREKEAADIQKQIEDAIKRDQEYQSKRIALVQKADKEEADLKAFRLNQDVKNADERISMQQTQSSLLLTNENLTSEQKIQIAQDNLDKLKSLIDERVRLEEDAINQIAATQSEQGDNDALIEAQRAQKIIDINTKAANEKADLAKKTTEAVKKESDNQQKIDEIRQKNAVALASSTFGTLAGLFKQQTIAYRVLASVQALIDTYRAAQAAYASASAIPIIGAVAGPIAAGVAVAAGLVNVAKINGVGGFAEGGYTGDGFGTPDESGFKPAGIVHQDEYVVPKRIVKSPQGAGMVRQLENMRVRGYAQGGFVNDGGISQRSLTRDIYEDSVRTRTMKNLISSMPAPVVEIVEINRAQAKRVKVVEKANV